MSQRNPIRMSQITERKLVMSSTDRTSKVTMEMCNYAKNVLNEPVISELAKNISCSVADCNKYWKPLMEMINHLDAKTEKSHPTLYGIVEYYIIPKLSKDNINRIIEYTTENENTFDRNNVRGIAEDYLTIERVVSNHKALSKRFNLDKIARESVRLRNVKEGVTELCELIDTYDISKQAKFNIALENITYAIRSAGYEESILEYVLDYFLTNESVIPDNIYSTMQSLVEKSRLLSDSEKQQVSYFTEAANDQFSKEIKSLANKCKNEDCSRLILSTLSISNEKQASNYIKKTFDMLNKHPEDSKYLISSIFAIPLTGKISKAFISYQYKLMSDKEKINNKINDKEFIDVVQDIMDDDDDMITEATLLHDLCNTDTISEGLSSYDDTPIASLLESEDYGDSRDIQALLKDFKAEQKKDMGKLKYYLGKIYRKSPEGIIDETPNILSTIRVVFILSPAVIPIIGPIISLVGAFVDKILSMKINEKQSEALIRKLESERDKVDKDIEKKPDKKEELEKYGKCIDACIKKVDGYREAHITSEELPDRRSTKKNSSVNTKDDDFDFDLGLDDDKDPWAEFDLENAAIMMSAMDTIVEARESNLEKDLCENITDLIDSDLESLLEIVRYCPTTININNILEAAQKCKLQYWKTDIVRSVLIESTVTEYSNIRSINLESVNDLLIEAYCVEQLEEAVKIMKNKPKDKKSGLSFITKLKLTLQAARGKAKDLSTKEKAMWRNLDIAASGFMKSVERAMTSDRRDAIIKGSIIPSFSKCIKAGMTVGLLSIVNPVLGIITAMGMIGVSKKLNDKERQLIYDEIDTELKVVDKQLDMANNDGNMKQYRFLLQYQKRLERERQRIKYGLKVHGRDIPDSKPKGDD